MLPFLLETFCSDLICQFLCEKTGGNAAHFFFARALCSRFDFTFFAKNRGKCCPFFCDNFLRCFDLSILSKPGKAVHFSARMFCSVWILQFSVKKRGKCCPFFCEKILQCFDASVQVLEEELPILLRELLAIVLMLQLFCSRQGETLPIFLAIVFYSVFRSLKNSSTLEEMLPVFLRTLFGVF